MAKDGRPAGERVRQLFVTAYGREPEPDEVKKAEEYLAKKNGEKAAWEDMVWALLNTKEFLFNH
jgi:hypothetical protein